MSILFTTPKISDLYKLGRQIELDRSANLGDLRERDHLIGQHCEQSNDVDRLLYWLRRVYKDNSLNSYPANAWFTEKSAAITCRFLAAFLGFSVMTGFLFAPENGIVNVFIFISIFIVVQLIFSLVSFAVLLLSWRGSRSVVFPLNPAKFIVSRAIPDRRYIYEFYSVVRILLLRYGQELGFIFTLGAMAAFFIALAFNDFTFVWGSTFNISNNVVRHFADIVALPWSAWLPDATVSETVVSGSRYSQAIANLTIDDINSAHGWWPLLAMAMCCYALMPRFMLWMVSGIIYLRLVRRSLVHYPGSGDILLRMGAPIINTKSLKKENDDYDNVYEAVNDTSLVLIIWAGALDQVDVYKYHQINMVPPSNILVAGLGTISSDEQCVDKVIVHNPSKVLVAVKAWEPPMADLYDFVNKLIDIKRCTLLLVPLPDKEVSILKQEEWRIFARKLRFDTVDTQLLAKY